MGVKRGAALVRELADADDDPETSLPAGMTVVDGNETPQPDEASPQPGTWEHDLATALEDIKKALGTSSNLNRRPLFDDDAVDVLECEFTEPSWLVRGLITRGGLLMIGAEPKVAKTWLGTEIALAIATGTPVCGEFFAERGRVAYFYAEDGKRQVKHRIRALLAGQGRRLQKGWFRPQSSGEHLDVTRDEDLAWIVASCRKLGAIDLLILDPLRDINSAAEDKSDEMSPVFKRLRIVGQLLGCTVGVVHHAGKASDATAKRRPGQRMRGSSAIHGSVDSGIYLRDADGDGTNVFRNVVDSEIKGARSAGKLTIELSIVDDANGEAICAAWKVTRDAVMATAAKLDVSSDIVSGIADELLAAPGHRRTTRELRRKPGGGKNEIAAGLHVMRDEGLVAAVMHGAKHNGWRLTPEGIRFASSGPGDPDRRSE